MGKISSQALDKFSHTKKSSRKFGRNFQKGPGGQISLKMSQEPKTVKKKTYQEVGHGTQENDLTIYMPYIGSLAALFKSNLILTLCVLQ